MNRFRLPEKLRFPNEKGLLKKYNQIMNILDKISALDNLTPNEEALVAMIGKEPEKFIALRPQEIAESVYVSLSTVYRFAGKLGYDGITPLKVDLAASLHKESRKETPTVKIHKPGSNAVSALIELRDISMEAVADTFSLINPEDLYIITRLMQDSHRVAVFSAYVNKFFAQNFQYQMREIGREVQIPEDPYFITNMAGDLNENDLGIILSVDGITEATIDAAYLLVKKKCPFILMTRNPDHPLSNLAAAVLMLPEKDQKPHHLSNISLRASILYALDSLFQMAALNRGSDKGSCA